MNEKRPGRELVKWVFFTLAMPFWLYVLTYYLTVDRAVNLGRAKTVPVYPVGFNSRLGELEYGSDHRWFFAPIHWLDRHFRPQFWAPPQ